jgi:N-acyl-D-amino-acid deacylase
MIDWLIKDAQIIDGTGGPSFRGDIAVSGEKILEIGRLGDPEAKRLVNADGKVVSPGFIDMHSLSERFISCPQDLPGSHRRSGGSGRHVCRSHNRGLQGTSGRNA